MFIVPNRNSGAKLRRSRHPPSGGLFHGRNFPWSAACFQSQRDCVYQPRVARHELPWEIRPDPHQPQRGCVWFASAEAQPRWGSQYFQHAYPG
jgi:hypothetical protein